MPITMTTGYRSGLIGEIAAAHARYYAEQWGFGVYFEAKVAADCAGFMERAGPDDLILSAWEGDTFAGSLIVDGHDPEADLGQAHLRWFIVTRSGRGLGATMMAQAIAWLDTRGVTCFLTTFRGLDAARRLYERHGFTLTDETETKTWGTSVLGQRFDRGQG